MGTWGIEHWKKDYAGDWDDELKRKEMEEEEEQLKLKKLKERAENNDGGRALDKSGKTKESLEKEEIIIKKTINIGVSSIEENSNTAAKTILPYPPTIVDILRGEEITSVSITKSPRALHSMIITVDGGDTFVGGDNSLGQLGISPQISTSLSLDVCKLIPSMAMSSCGGGHSVGISDKGSVFAWGSSMDGRLGVGLYFKVGVTDPLDKTTFAPSPVSKKPSRDEKNQLIQAKYDFENTTNPIVARKAKEYIDLCALRLPMAGLQVHHISCGYMHTVCSAGGKRTVFSFGSGVGYRLGHGDCVTTAWPRRLDSLYNQNISADKIHCCNTYTGIVTPNGLVYVWGRGSKGQLGLGGSSQDMSAILPRQMKFQRKKKKKNGLGSNFQKTDVYLPNVRISMLALSDSHGTALDVNGKVWSWGAAAAIGRRCRVMPTYTSAVKKEPRGGASIYCVPYHLPQPAWDPIPAIVTKLRKYPIGRAISIAAGKGFTVVATARRENSDEIKKKKVLLKKQQKMIQQQTPIVVPLTTENIQQQEQREEEGLELNIGIFNETDTSSPKATTNSSSEIDSELEEEMLEQQLQEEQNIREEDEIIENIGMRVLDVRGDVILNPHDYNDREDGSMIVHEREEDRILTVEETAGPCEYVKPDVLIDTK
jgi:hypothetical protein